MSPTDAIGLRERAWRYGRDNSRRQNHQPTRYCNHQITKSPNHQIHYFSLGSGLSVSGCVSVFPFAVRRTE
jgi:hypothetical protein